MSWLDVLVNSCEENECPSRFFYWSGLTALSAVISRKIFIERHFYKLYPNIYVFLVAGSGMKKGIAVSITKNLVRKAGSSRIISGRNSMAKIVQDLGKAFTLESGGVISTAEGFLVSAELAAFLVKDMDALTILTELHNTHENEPYWQNSIKGQSGLGVSDRLKMPCLTLLGATNEEHFAEAVPNSAIGGGFIARTFIVFSTERGRLNSLVTKPDKVADLDFLAEYLKEIAKITGEFRWSDAAGKVYNDWYHKFYKTDVQDPTGTMNRIGDQIIKVAMLLALAERPELIIKESHILEAIKVCLLCTSGMKQVTMGSGKSNMAHQTKIVLRELILCKDNRIERAKLLQKYWGEMDAYDLDRIILSLEDQDAIATEMIQGKKTYILNKGVLDVYTKELGAIQ